MRPLGYIGVANTNDSHYSEGMNKPSPVPQPASSTLQAATHPELKSAPIDAAQLLGASGEVKLLHNGDLYSLRRTRQGKLILTK